MVSNLDTQRVRRFYLGRMTVGPSYLHQFNTDGRNDGSVSGLFEQGKELPNQVIHEIHKLTERWQQRITLHNLRIAERFLNFELHLLLHVRVETFGSREMWGACVCNQVIARHPIGDEKVVVPDSEVRPMFIDVVQLVNSPQRVSMTPAFVWLKRINDFYRLWPDALYFSSLVGFVSSGILRNREFDSTARFLPRRTNFGQLVCEVVECAPEVVDNISGGRDDLDGYLRNFGDIGKASENAIKWRIAISENDVRVFTPTCDNRRFEVCEVLLGPFDFYSDKNKSAVCRQAHISAS